MMSSPLACIVIVIVAAVGLSLVGMCEAIPNITILGAFDYQMEESSPLVWSGRLVIMETIPNYNSQHQAFCDTDYFIVRDLLSWDIIATIQSSCNHAFGTALVTTDDKGTQTMWVFGTQWSRGGNGGKGKYKNGNNYNSGNSASNSSATSQPPWTGPCSLGKCALDMFWSTDLKSWNTATAVTYPPGMTVYNADICFVEDSPPSLPEHNWIQIIEEANPQGGFRSLFYYKNSSSLSDPGQWSLLDPSVYAIPNFNTGTNGIGTSPSIRFVPQTGYYYVTTGKDNIYVVRSKDLSNWELGHYKSGQVLSPSAQDCVFMPHSYTAWSPSPDIQDIMAACDTWDSSVSDADMVEYQAADGSVRTLVLYRPNNQLAAPSLTTSFSNMFLYPGNIVKFFSSYFDD